MIYYKSPEPLQDRINRLHKEAVPYVEKFCKTKNTKLLEIDVTTENHNHEPIYFFSDNLGGYTIKGIKESLDKESLD